MEFDGTKRKTKTKKRQIRTFARFNAPLGPTSCPMRSKGSTPRPTPTTTARLREDMCGCKGQTNRWAGLKCYGIILDPFGTMLYALACSFVSFSSLLSSPSRAPPPCWACSNEFLCKFFWQRQLVAHTVSG